MDSLMRFGRPGCLAVLKHFNEWICQNDKNPDFSRDQIAYTKVAKDLWFSSPKHEVLQDLWNNRVKNKDPMRGCLRKVLFVCNQIKKIRCSKSSACPCSGYLNGQDSRHGYPLEEEETMVFRGPAPCRQTFAHALQTTRENGKWSHVSIFYHSMRCTSCFLILQTATLEATLRPAPRRPGNW